MLVAMGRGGADEILYGGIPTQVGARTTRKLNKSNFIADRKKWLEQEKEFIDGVQSDLAAAVRNFASSDESWRNYLKIYAQAPDYSALNNLWARLQLRHKGVDPRGIILSESQWAKLGRRVKAEYAMPSKNPRTPAGRRDKRFGYDSDRDWDDRYCVELLMPIGGGRFEVELKDEDGNPILDENGEPKKRVFYRSPRGFKAFKAYHEAATEDIAGGEAKPLPAAPWQGASGTEEDAEKLIEDLEQRVAGLMGVEIRYDLDSSREALFESNRDAIQARVQGPARLEEDGKVLRVDPNAPVVDRATAMLGGLCEAVPSDFAPRNDDEIKRRRAAVESAKYAIASLYGLDSGNETFPHLAEIAEHKDGLRKLDSEIHRRTTKILHLIDPRLRMKARAEGEQRAAARADQAAKPVAA